MAYLLNLWLILKRKSWDDAKIWNHPLYQTHHQRIQSNPWSWNTTRTCLPSISVFYPLLQAHDGSCPNPWKYSSWTCLLLSLRIQTVICFAKSKLQNSSIQSVNAHWHYHHLDLLKYLTTRLSNDWHHLKTLGGTNNEKIKPKRIYPNWNDVRERK